MAILEKRQTEIPLNGGMDTKQGAELQSANTLREVTDLRWNKTGELEKRPNTASTVAVASPGGIGAYANLGAAAIVESRGEVYAITDEYGAMNESGAFAGGGGWDISLGAYPAPYSLIPKSCRVGRLTIDRCSGSEGDQGFETFASAVYASTTLVTAAVVRARGLFGLSTCILRLQAIDIETGAMVAQMQTVPDAASSTSWAVDACEIASGAAAGVIVTFASGSGAPYTIDVYRYRPATQDFTNDAAIGVTAATVRHRIKPSPTAGQFLIAMERSTNLLWAGEYIAGATTTNASTHVGTHTALGGVDIVVSGSKILLVSASSGLAGSVFAERYGTPGAYITAFTLGATEAVFSITAARETSSALVDRAAVFVSIVDSPAAAPFYYRLDSIPVDFTATTCTPAAAQATTYNHCVAAAWAVTHGDRAYVLTTCPLIERLSAMWLRSFNPLEGLPWFGRPVARVMHDVFADLRFGYTTNLLSTHVVGDIVYATLPADLSADTMPNGNAQLPQSVALSRLELAPRPLTYAQKDGVSSVASGVLFDLDGDAPMLSQPYCRPVISVSTATAGTTSLATGCSIVAVYRWIDAAGREHRSAPSAAASTGVITNKRIDVYAAELPYAPYTDTQGRTYSIDLYITEDGGSSYYLANTSASRKVTAYTEGSGVRLYQDLLAGVATNPPLYSTGDGDDELVSEPPPSFLAAWTVGDRMLAIDAEDRSRVWVSKPFAAGYAVEWNTAGTLTIGDKGVGGADVNGAPTVFAERGIWQIYGEGPNALGVGSFAPARRLPHEVECLDGLSVCKTGVGVFFRGRRGVYLLDTGLALQPVGLSIDPDLAVSGSITGYCRIVYDELSNEVHVMDFDATKHYVFNLLENKWCAWTQNALQYWRDAVSVRGRMFVRHYAEAGDSIKRVRAIDEDERNHHAYGWTLQTPWLRFDGATGEHRVWEIVIQLRVTGSHPSLDRTAGDISVEYDVRDLPTTTPGTFDWTDAQIYELSEGGEDRTINLRCHITAQRARQFRFRITESNALYGGPGAVPIAARIIYGVTSSAGRKTSTGQSKGTFVAT